jgi:hypothetical protein
VLVGNRLRALDLVLVRYNIVLPLVSPFAMTKGGRRTTSETDSELVEKQTAMLYCLAQSPMKEGSTKGKVEKQKIFNCHS